MKDRKPADLCRHLSLAMIGGFFGAYAIMSHGSLANAQTTNLLELLLLFLQGSWSSMPVYLGCFFLSGIAAALSARQYSLSQPADQRADRRDLAPYPGRGPLPFMLLSHFFHCELSVDYFQRGQRLCQLHHFLHQQHQAGLLRLGRIPVRR